MRPLTHLITGAILTATIRCSGLNQLEICENYALVTPTPFENKKKEPKISPFNLR